MCAVDFIAPGSELRVEIVQVIENPSNIKVVFYVMEGSFHTSRTIGIAYLMCFEPKIIVFGKGLHLCTCRSVLSGTSGDDDTGIVDHHRISDPTKILKSPGQKIPAFKSAIPVISICEDHPRVTQHQSSTL